MHWLYLAIAIVSEVVATSAMKATNGWSRTGPLLIVLIGYAISFYLLGVVLRTIHIGVAYAIWSGVGIVLLALIGWMRYDQKLDTPALLGLALILAGVVIINLFSNASVREW